MPRATALLLSRKHCPSEQAQARDIKLGKLATRLLHDLEMERDTADSLEQYEILAQALILDAFDAVERQASVAHLPSSLTDHGA